MKLIDILVRELPKRGGWPDGAGKIHQDYDGELWAWKGEDVAKIPSIEGIASNHRKMAGVVLPNMYVTRSQYEAALEARKPEWNGEGLPPVGRECEVKVGNNNFNLCRIVYSDSVSGVAFIYLGGDDEKYCGKIDCVSAKAAIDYFRPIRSEADKKRDEAIEAIKAIICSPSQASAVAEKVYEAISTGKIYVAKLED